MIYATHRLYDCMHNVTTFQVVETKEGRVSHVYDFECEKHSMLWYDAIILSKKDIKNRFFKTFAEILECLDCASENSLLYAYGVTYDADGCILSQLM